jgi:hypothetical protein
MQTWSPGVVRARRARHERPGSSHSSWPPSLRAIQALAQLPSPGYIASIRSEGAPRLAGFPAAGLGFRPPPAPGLAAPSIGRALRPQRRRDRWRPRARPRRRARARCGCGASVTRRAFRQGWQHATRPPPVSASAGRPRRQTGFVAVGFGHGFGLRTPRRRTGSVTPCSCPSRGVPASRRSAFPGAAERP